MLSWRVSHTRASAHLALYALELACHPHVSRKLLMSGPHACVLHVLQVMQKRTNVPGLKVRGRGRGRGGYMGRGVMPMMPYGMPMMPMPMMFAGRGRGAYGG